MWKLIETDPYGSTHAMEMHHGIALKVTNANGIALTYIPNVTLMKVKEEDRWRIVWQKVN